jgi:hypothetical protein
VLPGLNVCPWPGPEELPGQDEPITSPLWLVQVGGLVSCVILADALCVSMGAPANTNAAATAMIAVKVFSLFMVIFIENKI